MFCRNNSKHVYQPCWICVLNFKMNFKKVSSFLTCRCGVVRWHPSGDGTPGVSHLYLGWHFQNTCQSLSKLPGNKMAHHRVMPGSGLTNRNTTSLTRKDDTQTTFEFLKTNEMGCQLKRKMLHPRMSPQAEMRHPKVSLALENTTPGCTFKTVDSEMFSNTRDSCTLRNSSCFPLDPHAESVCTEQSDITPLSCVRLVHDQSHDFVRKPSPKNLQLAGVQFGGQLRSKFTKIWRWAWWLRHLSSCGRIAASKNATRASYVFVCFCSFSRCQKSFCLFILQALRKTFSRKRYNWELYCRGKPLHVVSAMW